MSSTDQVITWFMRILLVTGNSSNYVALRLFPLWLLSVSHMVLSDSDQAVFSWRRKCATLFRWLAKYTSIHKSKIFLLKKFNFFKIKKSTIYKFLRIEKYDFFSSSIDTIKFCAWYQTIYLSVIYSNISERGFPIKFSY